jgi:isoleucyl-tRNA synthetase
MPSCCATAPTGPRTASADVYLEGTDQHRGWFHSSLLQACGTIGPRALRRVLTHGFTMDEKGMKMSKSLGNTVVPAGGHQAVRRRYPAAVGGLHRLLGRPASRPGDHQDQRRCLPQAAQHMRWMLGSLAHFTGESVDHADMPELERLMLHRLSELDTLVRQAYDEFDFKASPSALFTFMTVELSAFYFDIRKDALYCDAPSSPPQGVAAGHRQAVQLPGHLAGADAALHHGRDLDFALR